MKDPLTYINVCRARAAQRPLNPQKPRGQAAAWTRFDIEHYALDLGWEVPSGYTLAPDPRLVQTDPVAWWREFFTRYYRAGLACGGGGLAWSQNFGGPIGTLRVGEILKNADICWSAATSFCVPQSTDGPEDHRYAVISAVRVLERQASPGLLRWPLLAREEKTMIEILSHAMGADAPPGNTAAMPPRPRVSEK